MAQVVQSNIPSLTAQRNLNRTNFGLNQALERLSSGFRINSAKDDAAGIAIASRFTSQIRGFNQAARNAADAISLVQTGEGALDEITANVQRIRELAIQSANSTNTSTDRAALQVEVSQLKQEIARVASGTKFNGVDIIGGGAGSFVFQVGADAGSLNQITVTTNDVTQMSGYADVATNGTLATTTGASTLIGNATTFLNSINSERANLGAVQNRFESVIRNTENIAENLSASRSRIQDADFAKETANLTKFQILQQAGVSVLSQANLLPQSALGLLG